MAILVVGSVALDSVETPAGTRAEALGGSASHFAMAASFFAPVRLVAVIGEDFGEERLAPFRERTIDLGGLVSVPGGKTFRWSGRYRDDLNQAETLETQLNVFAGFDPVLPDGWAKTPVVFLANIDPDLQARVLDAVEAPKLVAADTMNYWISSKPEALKKTLKRVDVQFLNDGEIRQLTGCRNLVEAAHQVRDLGPSTVVVKRGEHGVLVLSDEGLFSIPAFPLRSVTDPTGAGDSFAGGFLGFLARHLDDAQPDFRAAAVMGTILASFQVEEFSFDRLRSLTEREIRERYEVFSHLVRFPGLRN